MATTAGEFITKLATMAGLSTSDPEIVGILSNSEFSNYKLPENLYSKINSNLLTLDSARNNEQLRKHYHAEILNGLDYNIENVMEKFAVDADIAEQIRQEKKTTEKYNRLIEKLNDLHARKAETGRKTDKSELESEISKLNSQIKDLTGKLQTAPQERDSFWTEKLKTKAIQNMLTAYNYAGEKDIPKDVLIETARVLLNRKLNEAKVRLEYQADTDNISLKTESGMDFYKDNTPVSFKSFADQVLAESKLLAIPGANNAPIQQSAQPLPLPNQTIVSGGKSADTSKFFAALDDIAAGR
jgi:polyhydroxyalkanoate synthesis regulator phasin